MQSNLTATALILCLSTSIALADGHEIEEPNFVPVETFTCKFKDGADHDDLNDVIEEWNTYMDDEGVDNYFAATVQPHYVGEFAFDIGWLGAWADGNAMGAGTDNWLSTGGELNAKFLSVLDCQSHTNFASVNLKPPKDDDDYDFKYVEGYDDHTAVGADYERMGNGGAWRKNQELTGELLDCDVARLYNATVVRAMTMDDE
ncbi:MAG: hypothetical protein KJO82_14955 [Gammaproteobacteria bacterium]|nr:hypothetical protein [Gammaproteobacteria bacterium]